MPTLVSSAVGSQKVAAPRGGARRRPPPAATARIATPISVPSAPTSVAPPSPPPTQAVETITRPSQVEDTRSEQHPAATEQVDTRSIHTRSQTPRTRTEETPTEIPEAPDTETPPQNDGATVSKKRRREVTSVPDSAQPAKRAKRGSTSTQTASQITTTAGQPSTATTTATSQRPKTRKQVQEQIKAATAAAASAVDTSVAKKQAAKRGSKRRSAPTVVESEAEEDETQRDGAQTGTEQPAPKKKRRRNKKGRGQQTQPTDENAEGGDGQAEDNDDSDPELHEIDPNTVTMWEVGGDKRHGKTSEREKKMAEIDWVEVARKRREAAERAAANLQVPTSGDVVETTEGPSGTAEPKDSRPPPPSSARATIGGVQFRLINGQIVEDESSLTIDRQAQAEAEAANTTSQAIEEETDLTARINRTTYLNDRRREASDRVPQWKRKGDAWNEEDTDRFYEALKMFGTDFFIISKMFAPKTRRHIKLKFVREERLDPARINAALLGKQTKPMNLEHYAREVGRDVSEYTVYEGVKQAEERIRESLAGREEELRAEMREEERLEGERKREMELKEKYRRKGLAQSGKGKGKGGGGGGGRKGKKGTGEGETTVGGAERIDDRVRVDEN